MKFTYLYLCNMLNFSMTFTDWKKYSFQAETFNHTNTGIDFTPLQVLCSSAFCGFAVLWSFPKRQEEAGSA